MADAGLLSLNGVHATRSTAPEAPYVPPVLVKPEDYIEPRIGAEYQANVPDAALPRYPAGSGAGAAPRASVLDNIVCLHQRNKPSAEPDTGSGSSVYDILLDEYCVFQSQRRRALRGGRVADSRPVGPGEEVVLAALHGVQDDIDMARRALPSLMRYAEAEGEDARGSAWEGVLSAGRGYGIAVQTGRLQRGPVIPLPASLGAGVAMVAGSSTASAAAAFTAAGQQASSSGAVVDGVAASTSSTTSLSSSSPASVSPSPASSAGAADADVTMPVNQPTAVTGVAAVDGAAMDVDGIAIPVPAAVAAPSAGAGAAAHLAIVTAGLDKQPLPSPASSTGTSVAVSTSSASAGVAIMNAVRSMGIEPRETVTSHYVHRVLTAARAFRAAAGDAMSASSSSSAGAAGGHVYPQTVQAADAYDAAVKSRQKAESEQKAAIAAAATSAAAAASSSADGDVAMADAASAPMIVSLPELPPAPVPVGSSSPPLPPLEPVAKSARSRESTWSDAELMRFTVAFARHGKAFWLISRSVGTRTTQLCVSYYYTQWRRTQSYSDYKSYKDRMGPERRLDQELMRRDRAWFHFWRFDEDALGPPLPPAQVPLPPVLRIGQDTCVRGDVALPPTGKVQLTLTDGAAGDAASSGAVATVELPSPALPPGMITNDRFVLPLLAPNLDVLVAPDGTVLQAPPPKKPGEPNPPPPAPVAAPGQPGGGPLDATGSTSFTTGTTTYAGVGPDGAASGDHHHHHPHAVAADAARVLRSGQHALSQPPLASQVGHGGGHVAHGSDAMAVVVPSYPSWAVPADGSSFDRKAAIDRANRDLAPVRHVDPLVDYARVLRVAGSALKVAAGEAGATLPPTPLNAIPPSVSGSSCVAATSGVTISAWAGEHSGHGHHHGHQHGAGGDGCCGPHDHHAGLTPAHVHAAEIALQAQIKKAHVFETQFQDDRFIDNESYCGICGDGGDMICCDGPCRRSFHVPCLRTHDNGIRAAIKASPALQRHRWYSMLFDYDRDDWRCYACVSGVHECFICGENGHEGVDLFRCMRMCGKYFHLKCLSTWPLTQFFPANLNGYFIDPAAGKDHAVPISGGDNSATVASSDSGTAAGASSAAAGDAAGSSSSSPAAPAFVDKALSAPAAVAAASAELRRLQLGPEHAIAASFIALRVKHNAAAAAGAVEKLEDAVAGVADAMAVDGETTASSTAMVPAAPSTSASKPQSPPAGVMIDIPAGTSPKFVCPLHTCAGCKHPFHPFLPPLYFRCHACPSAFHAPCVPPGAQKDMNEIITCPNAAAHDAKHMTALYKQRSGVSRIRQPEDAEAAAEAAARRREAMMSSAMAGKGRIGDAVFAKLTHKPSSSGGGFGAGAGAGKGTGANWWMGGAAGGDGDGAGAGAAMPRLVKPAVASGSAGPSRPPVGVASAATNVGFHRPGPPARFANNIRAAHIDILDAAFYAEVKRRTDALVAQGKAQRGVVSRDQDKLPFTGIKACQAPSAAAIARGGKAAVQRWVARIFQIDTLRHLGTYEDALDAAVAFDYATTFLRGNTAPTVNFQGTITDCRVEAPIDPWPPSVLIRQESLGDKASPLPAWRPLPGEETMRVVFKERPSSIAAKEMGLAPLRGAAAAAAAAASGEAGDDGDFADAGRGRGEGAAVIIIVDPVTGERTPVTQPDVQLVPLFPPAQSYTGADGGASGAHMVEDIDDDGVGMNSDRGSSTVRQGASSSFPRKLPQAGAAGSSGKGAAPSAASSGPINVTVGSIEELFSGDSRLMHAMGMDSSMGLASSQMNGSKTDRPARVKRTRTYADGMIGEDGMDAAIEGNEAGTGVDDGDGDGNFDGSDDDGEFGSRKRKRSSGAGASGGVGFGGAWNPLASGSSSSKAKPRPSSGGGGAGAGTTFSRAYASVPATSFIDPEGPGADKMPHPRGPRSTYMGVMAAKSWMPGKERWISRVAEGNSFRYLGTFDTQAEAAAMYDDEIYKLRTTKAMTNFARRPRTDGQPGSEANPQARHRMMLRHSNGAQTMHIDVATDLPVLGPKGSPAYSNLANVGIDNPVGMTSTAITKVVDDLEQAAWQRYWDSHKGNLDQHRHAASAVASYLPSDASAGLAAMEDAHSVESGAAASKMGKSGRAGTRASTGAAAAAAGQSAEEDEHTPAASPKGGAPPVPEPKPVLPPPPPLPLTGFGYGGISADQWHYTGGLVKYAEDINDTAVVQVTPPGAAAVIKAAGLAEPHPSLSGPLNVLKAAVDIAELACKRAEAEAALAAEGKARLPASTAVKMEVVEAQRGAAKAWGEMAKPDHKQLATDAMERLGLKAEVTWKLFHVLPQWELVRPSDTAAAKEWIKAHARPKKEVDAGIRAADPTAAVPPIHLSQFIVLPFARGSTAPDITYPDSSLTRNGLKATDGSGLSSSDTTAMTVVNGMASVGSNQPPKSLLPLQSPTATAASVGAAAAASSSSAGAGASGDDKKASSSAGKEGAAGAAKAAGSEADKEKDKDKAATAAAAITALQSANQLIPPQEGCDDDLVLFDAATGMYIQLDPASFAPRLPLSINADTTLVALGDVFFDEDGNALPVPLGFKAMIAMPSYQHPSLKGVYVAEVANRAIAADHAMYRSYIAVKADLEKTEAAERAAAIKAGTYVEPPKTPIPADYPYKCAPSKPHVLGTPFAARPWLIRLRSDVSGVCFEGPAIAQVWLTVKKAIDSSQAKMQAAIADLKPQADAKAETARQRLAAITERYALVQKTIEERSAAAAASASPDAASSSSSSAGSPATRTTEDEVAAHAVSGVLPPGVASQEALDKMERVAVEQKQAAAVTAATADVAAADAGAGASSSSSSAAPAAAAVTSAAALSSSLPSYYSYGGSTGSAKVAGFKPNDYVRAMREDPYKFGLPKMTVLRLADTKDGEKETDFCICRHHKCSYKARQDEYIVPDLDADGRVRGAPPAQKGRFVAVRVHLWRHEALLHRHPDCDKSLCSVCAFSSLHLQEYTAGWKKAGVAGAEKSAIAQGHQGGVREGAAATTPASAGAGTAAAAPAADSGASTGSNAGPSSSAAAAAASEAPAASGAAGAGSGVRVSDRDVEMQK